MRLVESKKLHLTYVITDTIEAGIELFGYEVKSIRAKHGSLVGAYAIIRGVEAYLLNAFSPPYQEKNAPESYDPRRTRKLLLNKKELTELAQREWEGGLTLVPISLYNKGRKLKLQIAIARGKKKQDKRETLKKRTTEREVRREHKFR